MAGPFYFAWVDYTTGGVPAFGPEHQVFDEDIVNFKVAQTEGDCATMTIDIRNPRIGLLAPGRPVWAWLSYDSGTAGVVPLAFGRLVGIPTNILAEVVTLSFICKPLDFTNQKFALAETLKVRPFYDPIFIDPKKRPGLDTAGNQVGDPDVVLEGYSALWHIDRLSLQMTISDIIDGEDGTEIFGPDEIPYDSVQIEIGQAPLTSVKVIETADWSQAATGQIDFGERWFDTWTGGSIIGSWPQTGQQLASGWSVVEGWAIDVLNVSGQQAFSKHFAFENREKTHAVGDVMSVNLNWTEFPVGGALWISDLKRQAGVVPAQAVVSYGPGSTMEKFPDGSYQAVNDVPSNPYAAIDGGYPQFGDQDEQTAIPLHMSYNQVLVPGWIVHTKLVLGYNAGGKRNETAEFTLVADLQEIVTLPDPTDIIETLELNGTDVGLPVDGAIPIVDTARNQYFPTDRGQWSLEYGICVARAHILMRARAINMTWECGFDRAIALTLRKNAQITDDRIPGGVASGKIIAYSFGADGDAAMMSGSVTIGCTIGRAGAPISSAAGTPDYVQAGYVTDYQTYSGSSTAIAGGAVGYSIPIIAPVGLIDPLTKDQVVVDEHVSTTELTDWVQVGSDTDEQGNTVKTFARYPMTSYYLELIPISDMKFDNAYDINVTVLNVPKTIDLEAATTL